MRSLYLFPVLLAVILPLEASVHILFKTKQSNTFHSDLQYNVRALSDSNGNIVELYAYSPYGDRTVLDSAETELKSASTDYVFTGRRFDAETGMWCFRARCFGTTGFLVDLTQDSIYQNEKEL